jgi:hypothetical protein
MKSHLVANDTHGAHCLDQRLIGDHGACLTIIGYCLLYIGRNGLDQQNTAGIRNTGITIIVHTLLFLGQQQSGLTRDGWVALHWLLQRDQRGGSHVTDWFRLRFEGGAVPGEFGRCANFSWRRSSVGRVGRRARPERRDQRDGGAGVAAQWYGDEILLRNI